MNLYQATVFLYALFAFPYYLYRYGFRGIKTYFQRWRLPKKTIDGCYWVHAVSLGEVKLALSYIALLKRNAPDTPIALSTSTPTGFKLAQKHEDITSFMFPFDLLFLQRRVIERLNPKHFFITEGDLWFGLIHLLSQKKIPISVINGKMSMSSYKMYRRFRNFTEDYFSQFYAVSAQTPFDCWAFRHLGVAKERIQRFDNLKLQSLRLQLTITKKTRPFILSLVSTHPHEEQLLLDALYPLFLQESQLQIIVIPRHPERFSSVDGLLKKYYALSSNNRSSTRSRLHLWDKMGQLDKVYALSSIAIIGGSYVAVGGHNITEPLPFQTIPVTGPYMHKQRSMLKWALDKKVIKQCSLEELPTLIKCYMNCSDSLTGMQEQILNVLGSHQYPEQELLSFSLK